MNSFTKPIDTVITDAASSLILHAPVSDLQLQIEKKTIPEPAPRKERTKNVRHYVEVLQEKDKHETLLQLLQSIYSMPENEFCKTLVFATYKCMKNLLRYLPPNLSCRVHFVGKVLTDIQKAELLKKDQLGIWCALQTTACTIFENESEYFVINKISVKFDFIFFLTDSSGITFKFVINRTFTKSMKTYCDREAICEESMISFFTLLNREHLVPLTDMLKKRKKVSTRKKH
jgi:hypothetical protein